MAGEQSSGSKSVKPRMSADVLGRRHQLAAGTITGVCLCVLATSWLWETYRRGQPIDVERPFTPPVVQLQIDLNRAEWPELTLLPQISETMARRVVAYRELHGSFASLDDVQNVDGIGPRTFARIAPHLSPVNPLDATAEHLE